MASFLSGCRCCGWWLQGFKEVRAEFSRNLAERGEIGAAVAAHWRGVKVVDLWGGPSNPAPLSRASVPGIVLLR